MKTIYIIPILLMKIVGFSQQIIPLEDMASHVPNTMNERYFKDVNNQLDKFLGTWKYQNDPLNPTKILVVTFLKDTTDNSGSYRTDHLYGKYIYIENGVEIYNTTQEQFPILYGGMFRNPSDTDTYNMIYDEPTLASKSLRYSFKLHYYPTEPHTLQWDVDVTFEVAEGAELPRIPQHITLVKLP